MFDCGEKARDYEYRIHELLEHHKSHGEWFDSTGQIRHFIAESIYNFEFKLKDWCAPYNSIYYQMGDEWEGRAPIDPKAWARAAEQIRRENNGRL